MSDTAPVASAPATTTLLTEPATTPEGATTTAPDATAPATADAPADSEAPASEAPAPIEYAFTAPDGVELDVALIEQVTPLFADAKLPPATAQKVVDAYAAHVAARDTAAAEAHAAQVQVWADEVRADPLIGGANLKATLASAHRAIHQFGGDPLKALLNETGLGNHPVLVRAFAAAGAAVSEDTTIRGSSGGIPEPTRALGARIFTTMKPKE